MTADTSRDLLAWLETAISERETAVRRLVGVGGCPDWGHCRPDCTHENRYADVQQDVTDRLRRYAADRKLLNLHGGRAHSCPAWDEDGDFDQRVDFYNHEVCPVVESLAEGYGWAKV
ncbi:MULTISPECIES: hypothetical protein [Streptomyces rochei group]|uniref:hypothetical protein n=1 Tax=Streptomyces rochei group TaxID=2867164 RepID=UPI001873E72D|nr:hypothetical protein [Streptomyces vinaceusdrappus]GHC36717.1 hypothetical protein GCM10010308_63970 [Streptomyces vinaceusdrappus]